MAELIEMECLVCGDLEWLDPSKIHICDGCGNGPMAPRRKEK